MARLRHRPDAAVRWLGTAADASTWLVSLGPVWPPSSGASLRHAAPVAEALRSPGAGIVYVDHDLPDSQTLEWARRATVPIGWLPRPDRGRCRAAAVFVLAALWRVPYHVAVMRLVRRRAGIDNPRRIVCLQGAASGFVRRQERHRSVLSLCDFDPEYAENRASEARGPVGRVVTWVNWQLAARYYQRAYTEFAAVITISVEDRERVTDLSPGAKVETIPLSIDIRDDRRPAPLKRLVFVGSGSRNLASIAWSLEHVVPQLGDQIPFVIAGRFSRDEVRTIHRWIGDRVRSAGWITVEESPVDITEVLRPGSAMLAPFPRGSGVKVKCVEAMLRGCLVVTNAAGARGIAIESGRTGVVMEDGHRMAAEIRRLIAAPEEAVALAGAGRRSARESHGPGIYASHWRRACGLDEP